MITFFRHSSTRVDYGEQESCGEQLLLHLAEYQEYLSCEAPFCPTINHDRLADPASADPFSGGSL